MPVIKPVLRQQSITGESANVMANVAAAGAVPRAIGNMGESLGNAVAMVTKRYDEVKKEEAHYSALRIGATVNEDALQFENERMARKGTDAFNSMQAVDEWTKDRTEKYTKDLDDRTAFVVSQNILAQSLRLKRELSHHEIKQRDLVADDSRNAILSAASKEAYQGRGTIQENFAPIEAALVADPRLRDEERINKIAAAQSAIAASRLDGMIVRNPELAVKAIQDGDFSQWLSKEKLMEYEAKAQPVINQNAAKGIAAVTWEQYRPKGVNDSLDIDLMRKKVREGNSSEIVKELAEKQIESLAREYQQSKRIKEEFASNRIYDLAINKKATYADVVKSIRTDDQIDAKTQSALLDWADRKYEISEGRAEARAEARLRRNINYLSNMFDLQQKVLKGELKGLTPRQVGEKYLPVLGPYSDEFAKFINSTNDKIGTAKITDEELKDTVRMLRFSSDKYSKLLPAVDKSTPEDKAKMAVLQNYVQDLVATSNVSGKPTISTKEAVLRAIKEINSGGEVFGGIFGTNTRPVYSITEKDIPRMNQAQRRQYVTQQIMNRNGGVAPSERQIREGLNRLNEGLK